jgi:DNA-binding MarR family transcriptional regulator
MADTKLKTRKDNAVEGADKPKDNVKEMANRLIPEDLRSMLDSVKTTPDWAILSELESGPKTYPEIVKDLGLEGEGKKLEIERHKLKRHLEKLLKNGIITQFYHAESEVQEFFSEKNKYYELTNIGRNIIKSIDFIFYIPDNVKEKLIREELIKNKKADEQDWAILSELYPTDKRFKDIIKDLKMEDRKQEVEEHLEKLLEYEVIEPYYIEEINDPDYLYYKLTKIGRNIIESSISAFKPYKR